MFSRVFLLAVCDPSPYGFDSQCEKNPQLIPTTSTNSTKALERWEDKQVRLLIASYMKFKDKFGKSHITPTINSVGLLVRTRSIFPW